MNLAIISDGEIKMNVLCRYDDVLKPLSRTECVGIMVLFVIIAALVKEKNKTRI